MSLKYIPLVALACGLGLLCHRASAESVVLRSGNGSVGGPDSAINMLLGPIDTNFPSAFTPADFLAARLGADASIIAPNAAWIASLPSDASARWISTGPGGAGEGGTALYAIDFILTQPFTDAALDLRFAVDNALGTGPNQGVFLNGVPISGSSTASGFAGELSITRNDIAPLLLPGLNTLYINSTDQGGPGGLIFSARIDTRIVPEPGGLTVLGMASLGLLLRVRRRAPGQV